MKVDLKENDARACVVCIKALSGTAMTAAEHFNLSLLEELDAFHQEYLKALGVA